MTTDRPRTHSEIMADGLRISLSVFIYHYTYNVLVLQLAKIGVLVELIGWSALRKASFCGRHRKSTPPTPPIDRARRADHRSALVEQNHFDLPTSKIEIELRCTRDVVMPAALHRRPRRRPRRRSRRRNRSVQLSVFFI